MTIVLIDGARVAVEEARVSVLDRGFLFGDSVFEVIRAYAGRPFALEEHLDRLERSLAGMGIRQSFERAALVHEVQEALAALGTDDAYVRIVVTRGTGPLHLDARRVTGPATRVVIAAPLLPLPPALYQGVSIATVPAHRSTDGTRAQGAKVSAYVANLLALMEAQARGAYEAAFVADDGSISEGHSSNLFVVRGRTLLTPPLSCGALPGITRAMVIGAAAAEGIPFRESVLFSRDFEVADEAFLTSSLRELVPVTSIDGAPVGSGRPGPMTLRLHCLYRDAVAGRARGGGDDGPRR